MATGRFEPRSPFRDLNFEVKLITLPNMNRIFLSSSFLGALAVSVALAEGVGTAAAPPAPAATAAESAEPTPQQVERVVTMLGSPVAAQRQAAYKACRARGEGFRYSYFQMLMRAEQLHAKELGRQARDQLGPSTAVGATLKAWKEWKAAADAARAFVLIDHHKDQAKFDEMDKLYTVADKAWQDYTRQEKKFTRAGDTVGRLDAAATALREIHLEKAYAQPDLFNAAEVPDLKDLEESLNLGKGIGEFLQARTEMAALRTLITEVAKANESASWAKPPQKQFADLLNQRRVVIGCRPLRIEEKLSEASTDHSKEMIALGYFAHESPVEANKTPWQRAANAKFAGNAAGECIFMGSPDPGAAERGWWYSDGHRLINYATGPNVIGLGPVAGHWTLMTGNLGQ